MIFPCTSFIFRLPYWYFKISRFWQDNISRTVLIFAILTGKYDKNIKFRDLSVLSFILFFYVGILNLACLYFARIYFRRSLISRFFSNREKRAASLSRIRIFNIFTIPIIHLVCPFPVSSGYYSRLKGI